MEWKWDGIRAQLVKRGGQFWLWSRGEELVSEHFPELAQAGLSLPDGTVLDGEIVVWRDGRSSLSMNCKNASAARLLGSKILREQPVVLLAYDLLEEEGSDLRRQPQYVRRARLEALLAKHAPEPSGLPLRLSPAAPRQHMAGVGDPAGRRAQPGHGRFHAQAAQCRIRRGTHQGRRQVVEMEDRSR